MSNSGQKCVPVISAAAKAVNFVDNGASVSRQSLLNKETAGVNQQQAFVCAVSWAFAKECHLSQLSNLVCRRGSAECDPLQGLSNQSPTCRRSHLRQCQAAFVLQGAFSMRQCVSCRINLNTHVGSPTAKHRSHHCPLLCCAKRLTLSSL